MQKSTAIKKAPTDATENANVNNEDKSKIQQLQIVFDTYFLQPLTMKECDRLCGIMRENICWYNRMLRLSNRIYCIGKRYCTVTKHRAGVYTTNPKLVPVSNQLNLFTDG